MFTLSMLMGVSAAISIETNINDPIVNYMNILDDIIDSPPNSEP